MFRWFNRIVSWDLVRKYSALKLAFCWIVGLICGWKLFVVSGFPFESLLLESLTGLVSAGGLVIRVLCPFLICWIGVSLEQRWLIFGCAFVRAALFVFTSLCAMAGFGAGGWLIRFLFLFTDTLTCALWYGFCLYCLSESGDSSEIPLLFCAIGLLIAGIDLRVIMPLLQRIINC